jgi:hypothetical protein
MGDSSPSSFVQTGQLFYDSGSTDDYGSSEKETITFKCAAGSVIRVTFTEFKVEERE